MSFDSEKLLDSIGLKILAALQENARTPLNRIGERVGLSAPAVAERVRKLEEAGVIEGYHARLNPAAVGLTVSAFINLTTEARHYPAVKKLAAGTPQIVACHHVSGGPSFILQVRVADLPELEAVVERLSPFGQTQTAIVLSTSLDRAAAVALP